MNLVEKHYIGQNHEYSKECRDLCFLSKNLHNASLYNIRQHYFDNKTYLSYNNNYHLIKHSIDYKALPAKISCQILKLVDKNFKSFFAVNRKFKQGKLKDRPSIPGYIKEKYGRDEQFVTIYPKQALSLGVFKKTGLIHLSKTNIYIKTKIKNWSDIKEVKIVPSRGRHYIMVGYNKDTKPRIENNNYAGIDIGLNNLATVVFSQKGIQPIIINGRPLKSINQFYNKQVAFYKSEAETKNGKKTTNRLKKLAIKREHKISDYLHKATTLLANHIEKMNVSFVVYGRNKEWKNECNMGKKGNQNFVGIPMDKFRSMLKYKLELRGITLIDREESYTSKCSFLDLEPICKHDKYMGKRVKRGQFKSSDGTLINADINGAYNILRKEIPHIFIEGIEGLRVIPLKLKI